MVRCSNFPKEATNRDFSYKIKMWKLFFFFFCNTVTLYQSISVGQILLAGCSDLEISGSKEIRRDGNPGQSPRES